MDGLVKPFVGVIFASCITYSFSFSIGFDCFDFFFIFLADSNKSSSKLKA